ncbi:MAG: hypothetical protein PUB57_02550 [Selenomonadaceae bacterium]|nr:hypothetical protein [Selenomonadaceae bacterium]
MIEVDYPLKWEPYGHVPYGVKDSTLYVGKGENLLQFDLDAMQKEGETVILIYQDKQGTLYDIVDAQQYDNPAYLVARVTIPPGQYEVYDTGETRTNQATGKKGKVQARKKLPVDVENCKIERCGSWFKLEQEEQKEEEE